MAKQLIGIHNLDAYIHSDTRTMYVDRDMILSPGAKDLLRNRGIGLEYGPAPQPEADAGPQTVPDSKPADMIQAGCQDARDCPLAADCVATGPGSLCQTLGRAIEILTQDFGIKDKARLEALSSQIVEQLKTDKGDM